MTAADPALDALLGFWFSDAARPRWFDATPAFDAELATSFGTLHDRAAKGALDHWVETPQGALGLVLLLDQLPRNLFRGTPRAFATDDQARAVTDEALARGHDRHLDEAGRAFLYMPLEHCEDPDAQARCVQLMAQLSDPGWAEFARKHRDVIDRFGRFPSRNAVLGRDSTAAEQAFLAEHGPGW
jgi:uncharacterized protein (DUF924 family)